MIQVIAATFEDGVFRPELKLTLPPRTRVRLVVETLEEDAEQTRQQSWETILRLWQQTTVDSRGQRLTREQLHERA